MRPGSYIRDERYKAKMSQAIKAWHANNPCAAKHISERAKLRLSDPQNHPLYGHRRSQETKHKIREAVLLKGVHFKIGNKPLNARPKTLSERINISCGMRQLSRTQWDGFATESNYELTRQSLRYRRFLQTIKKRDHYTCRICGEKNPECGLCVDHILPLSIFPERMWDRDNLRTLCEDCHKDTPTYGGRFVRLKHSMPIDVLKSRLLQEVK